jgi:large subunit ribosomal protein L6
MSRIGKLQIKLPSGVTIEEKPNHILFVKGSKGELSMNINPKIEIEIADGMITCKRKNDGQEARSLHGLTRTLVANMIEGVTKGFEKKLDIQGVGYRATLAGTKLVLALGYSHPIEIIPPKGITVTIDAEKKNILTVSGIDKQAVGELAAKIRSLRKPEPYKGKGIRYLGEYIARKAGKAAAKEK